MPVVGRLVADAIEGKLPPELVKKFEVGRVYDRDVSEPAVRAAPPADLVVEELCTPEDLLPGPGLSLSGRGGGKLQVKL